MTACGTILVVDDDDDTRDCVTSVLEGQGYDVRCARNGREALALLDANGAPDLVLLDLMMPIMTGWDVLEAIDQAPQLKSLNVVVLTASGQHAADSTRRPVLHKPVALDRLLATVRRFCNASANETDPMPTDPSTAPA